VGNEREVLQLIAEGRSTREIAERLNLSVKTIETHRAQLMQRLEIFEVAGLTRYALRIGPDLSERLSSAASLTMQDRRKIHFSSAFNPYLHHP
jgi:DNA-binding CsgD family transcriptional regulator